MGAAYTALIAFSVIFGMAMLGLRLQNRLRDNHLSPETKDVVRLGMGLVATMTALLIGLLIASAKGSYDTQRATVVRMASEVAFLDRALAVYGTESGEARAALRRAAETTIHETWNGGTPSEGSRPDTQVGLGLYDSIQRLAPKDEVQRSLKSEAIATTEDIGRTRWLLFAQRDSAIATPLLAMVIAWLALIFLSFGLFAPSNRVVITTLFLVAMAVSSALFLVLELDQPFRGVIQISSEPIQRVIDQLGR